MRAVVGDYLSDVTESVQKRAFNILYPDSSYIQALSKYGCFWYITWPAFVVIKALLTKRPFKGACLTLRILRRRPVFLYNTSYYYYYYFFKIAVSGYYCEAFEFEY